MTDQTETLQAALQEAHRVLSALDAQAQADPPAPDHFVKVTVEAWRDGIRPVIGLIREALDTPPAADCCGNCPPCPYCDFQPEGDCH